MMQPTLPTQLRELLELIPADRLRDRALVQLALATELDFSTLLRLRVRQVCTLTEHGPQVRHQVDLAGSTVRLNSTARAAVLDLLNGHPAPAAESALCVDEQHRPLSLSTWRGVLAAADLAHGFAVRLAERGVSAVTIRQLVGHARCALLPGRGRRAR